MYHRSHLGSLSLSAGVPVPAPEEIRRSAANNSPRSRIPGSKQHILERQCQGCKMVNTESGRQNEIVRRGGPNREVWLNFTVAVRRIRRVERGETGESFRM